MQISFYLFFSVWAEGQLIRLQGEISGGDPREPFLCSPFRRRGEQLGFPKDSGTSLHLIPVECRNKTPSPWHKEKMSVPWSALHPPPLYITAVCLSQPDVPQNTGGNVPRSSIPASPGPHMDPYKLMGSMLGWGGRSSIPWMEGRAELGYHLGWNRPPPAAFEVPFFDRKYNFVTPPPEPQMW